MPNKTDIWSDKNKRKAHLNSQIEQTQSAFFGFEKVDADEKAHKVRRHFDRVARRYDLMNTLLSFGIHYQWKRLSIRILNLKPGDRVLDVCGGTGDLSVMAARYVKETGLVMDYDINREMMLVGREKISRTPFKGSIRFIQGDAERISFPDDSFDAALVGFGIRNVTRMEQGFKEMHRVLKPGGQLMCLEFSKPKNRLFRRLYDMYSFHFMPLLGRLVVGTGQPYACLTETIRMFPLPEELIAILNRIGFSHVTYRRLTNGIAVIHHGVKA
jgi:demethylmenaquinone methyltransferase/2-methoxy-6-polyprenyl-1,4-benzoquinol methylase